MFTGLVEETGRVVSFEESSDAWVPTVACKHVHEGASIGDSIAVNGCCLTLVRAEGDLLSFELLAETLRLTGFGVLQLGSLVNLERSLPVNGRPGGHFVSGHVDALGTILTLEARGKDMFVCVQVPQEFHKYLVCKGCIAIDGVSLTVAGVTEQGIELWIIRHTLAETNLSQKKAGDVVHLEFDLLAKYTERLLESKLDT